MQPFEEFFDSESSGPGAGREFADQLGELPLPLPAALDDLLVADKGARSLVGFEHATEFQFAVCPQDGIRIDGQIHRKLPHGGKLIARRQRSRRDPAQNLVDDLAIDGNSGPQVQFELGTSAVSGSALHACQCTILLVQ